MSDLVSENSADALTSNCNDLAKQEAAWTAKFGKPIKEAPSDWGHWELYISSIFTWDALVLLP